MEFIILTGMSGAGKSQAANTLEDIGFYCVDNMPAMLISKFVEIYDLSSNKNSKVAFVIDVRGENEFTTLAEEVRAIKHRGYDVKTIFLECDDGVLITRYKETRRIHPLSSITGKTMDEALKQEREMLSEARDYSDYVINTSKLTALQLRNEIFALITHSKKNEMLISCISFGFKYGIPTEADLVFDVRCFRNPFYIDSLKEKTGLEQEVIDYVFSFEEVEQYLEKLFSMLDFMIPLYKKEGKAQVIIGTGCTGGKHRSVAITERIAAHFNGQEKNVSIIHRDILKK